MRLANRLCAAGSAFLLFGLLIPAHADVTVVYQQQIKLDPSPVAKMSKDDLAMMKALAATDYQTALGLGMPVKQTVYECGSLRRVDMGDTSTITDTNSGQITVIDRSHKSYVVLSKEDKSAMTSAKGNQYIDLMFHATSETRSIIGHPARHYTTEPLDKKQDSHIDVWTATDLDSNEPIDEKPAAGSDPPPAGVILSSLTIQQMGKQKATSTLLALSVSTKTLPPSIFAVPKGYWQQDAKSVVDTVTAKTDPTVAPKKAAKATPDRLVAFAAAGDVEAMTVAISGGVDVNAQDGDGDTALTSAAEIGWVDAVKLLREKGADPNLANSRFMAPLDLAVASGSVDCVKALLDHGAKLDDQGLTLGTPAVSLAMAQLLLDHGANVKPVAAGYADDPLLYAVTQSNFDLIKLYVAHGAEINLKHGETGQTVLMLAAGRGRADIVAYLLQQGADPSIQSNEGSTALSDAKSGGHESVVKLLTAAIRGSQTK